MTAVTVHAACADDIPAVAAPEALCFSCPWREKDFADMLTDPARTLLVAETDGAFSGYIAAYTVLDESDITTVAVPPALRGRGAGRALVEAAKQAAHEAGYAFMQVKTVQMGKYAEYDATNRFYLAMGFREFEVFPQLWDEWNPCQVYVMGL